MLPPPAGYYPGRYANGGTLPTGGLASAPGASGAPAPNSGLLKAQARTNELLEQVVGHTAESAGSNKRIAGFGPPVLAFEYEAEAARR